MPEPITPARIRDVAGILRVTYLPVMTGSEAEDWREQVDVSEALADLLDLHAGLLEYAPPRESRPFGKAVTVLVQKLEGSHS